MESSNCRINKLVAEPRIKIKIRIQRTSSPPSHPGLQELAKPQEPLLAPPPVDHLLMLAEAAERILGNVFRPSHKDSSSPNSKHIPIPPQTTRTAASPPQEDHHGITSSALVEHKGLEIRKRNPQENEALIHHSRKKPKRDILYSCTDCYQKFPSPQALGGHRTGCHLRPQNPNIIRSYSFSSLGNRGEHPCPRCDKSFRSVRALSGHTRVHSPKRKKAQTSAYTLPPSSELPPPSGGVVSSVCTSLSPSSAPHHHDEPSALLTSSASQSSETYGECQSLVVLHPGNRDEPGEHKYRCCDLNMRPPSEEEDEHGILLDL